MGARELLLRGYDWMRRAVAPRVRYSQEEYEEVLRAHVGRATAWLDLGCGRRILPPWRGEAEQALVRTCPRVIGVDIDHDAIADNLSVSLKCLATGTALPFAAESFDLVTANMVVEHLQDPTTNFREVSRVLKPGGVFLLHTPNAMGYPTLLARIVPEALKKRAASLLDGRREADVYPTFYRANSRRSIEAIARESSFETIDVHLIVTTAMFAVVPPMALLELLLLRALMHERLSDLRTNIIAALHKRDAHKTTQAHHNAFAYASSSDSATRGQE
jgi:ubiquinone/menaquinone biosynthesis C-methylase UbiE